MILDGRAVAFNVAMQERREDISGFKSKMAALGLRAVGYEYRLEAARVQKEIFDDALAARTRLWEIGLIRRAMAEAEGQIGRFASDVAKVEGIRNQHEPQGRADRRQKPPPGLPVEIMTQTAPRISFQYSACLSNIL